MQEGGNKMIEIGRLCVKIAGRDSGKKCVIVDILEPGFVLIDGETRRRKCNIKHIEFLEKKIDLTKGADRKKIIEEFKKLGIELREKKAKTVYTKPLKKRILKMQAQMEKKKTEKEKKAKEKAEKKKTEIKEKLKEEKKPEIKKKTEKKEEVKKEVKEEKPKKT